MVKVLSIQSDVIGNKTYCASLRECFASMSGVQLTPFWYREERDLSTRLLTRAASVIIPGLGAKHRNLDLHRARIEWSFGHMSRLLAERKMAEKSYDVLHFHTQVQAFGAAALMRKSPTVITTDITNLQVSREPLVRHPSTFNLNIKMERRVFAEAAHIVTFSEWTRQSVVNEYDVPATKVTAIIPGARSWQFGEPDYTAKVLPRILFVGGDFARKGGWDLLKAFEGMADYAELHLVTPERIPNPGKNVFVHHGIAAYTDAWHSLFRSAAIFALPSHADAVPHVLQEAAWFGLALVGTAVGGVPEIVANGENGLLVPPGDPGELRDALNFLLHDPERLHAIRRRSRQIAEKRFDAVQNYARLAEVLIAVARSAPVA